MFGRKEEINNRHLMAVRLMYAFLGNHVLPITPQGGFKMKVTKESDGEGWWRKFKIWCGRGTVITFNTAVRNGGILLDGQINHPEYGTHTFRAFDYDGRKPTEILTIFPTPS